MNQATTSPIDNRIAGNEPSAPVMLPMARVRAVLLSSGCVCTLTFAAVPKLSVGTNSPPRSVPLRMPEPARSCERQIAGGLRGETHHVFRSSWIDREVRMAERLCAAKRSPRRELRRDGRRRAVARDHRDGQRDAEHHKSQERGESEPSEAGTELYEVPRTPQSCDARCAAYRPHRARFFSPPCPRESPRQQNNAGHTRSIDQQAADRP